MIKKHLCILLSAILLVISLPVSAALEEPRPDEVEFLTAVGLLDSEEYNGEKIITRAEYAGVVTKMIGMWQNDGMKNIETLYVMNAMDKNKLGYFGGDEPLTYNEAVLALLTVIDYDIIANSAGGYPKGYAVTASKNDLTCGKTGNQSLTWNDASKLVFKALWLPSVEGTYGQISSYYLNKDIYVMEQTMGIKVEKGIVTANSDVNLHASSELSSNQINIDDITYKIYDSSYENYLGEHVLVYYSEKGGDRVALFMMPEKTNEKTIIDADDILSFSNGKYRYENDGRKIKNILLESDAVILYNGVLPKSSTAMKFIPTNGWIEFIDNDSNSKADIVKICDYINYVVDDIKTEENDIYLYSSGKKPVHIVYGKEKGNTKLFTSDGGKLKIKDVKKTVLMSVLGTEDNGIIEADTIYSSDKIVSGKVVSLEADERKIGIEEEEYIYDKAIKADIEKLVFGSYRNFLIDFRNRIAGVNNERLNSYNQGVGYILKGAPCSRGLSNKWEVKLYDVNGFMRLLETGDRLYIDGTLYKGKKNVCDAMSTAQLSGMVSYTLSNDGTLRSLDFPSNRDYALNGEPEAYNHFVKDASGKYMYRSAMKGFSGVFVCNEDVKVVNIPSDIQKAEDTDFSVGTLNDFVDARNYNLEAYSYNSQGIGVDFIVRTVSSADLDSTSPIYVVQSMKKALNEDGNYTDVIKVIGIDGAQTLECRDENVLTECTSFSDDTEKCTVQVGDIVKLVTDNKERILAVKMVNDASATNGFKVTPSFGASGFTASYRIIQAKVYDKAGDVVLVTQRDLSNPMDNAVYSDFEAHPLARYKIVVVEDEKTVRSGNASDIRAYKLTGNDYSNIVLGTKNGAPSMLVIYE